ncbi:MAG: hypothetical protein U1D41_05920 [Nitrosomonas sp.]|uniref:hypothetical protein n=1 Tax=Nitrosomonas sp. TaxID=42353 RepID=UPI002ABBB164|nr:hypothetical protein [Nitrosomonas sp.]MDZ4105689.1 hypothetical protein [Nitrosomonas sp.]
MATEDQKHGEISKVKHKPFKPKRTNRSLSPVTERVVSLSVVLKTVDFEGMTIACSDSKKGNDRFDFSRWVESERKYSGQNTGNLKLDCPLLFQLLEAFGSDRYKLKGQAWTHGSRAPIFRAFGHFLPFAYGNNLVPLSSRVLTVELWEMYIQQWKAEGRQVSTFNGGPSKYIGVLIASGELEDKYRRSWVNEKDTESELLILSQKEIRSNLTNHPYKKYERELKHKVKDIFDRWDYVMEVIKTQKDPQIQIAPRCLTQLRSTDLLNHFKLTEEDWNVAVQRIALEAGEIGHQIIPPPSGRRYAVYIPLVFDKNCHDHLHLALHRQLLCKGLTFLRQDPTIVKKTRGAATRQLSVFKDVTRIPSSFYFTLAQSIWAAHLEFKKVGGFRGVNAIKNPMVPKSVLRDGAELLLLDANTMYTITAYLSIKTGWNLETLSSIPISLDECMESVSSKDPGIVKIWAFKGRSKRDQYVIDNIFSERKVYSQIQKKKNGEVVFKKVVHKLSYNHVGSILQKVREYLEFLNKYVFDVGLNNPERRLLEHFAYKLGVWISFSGASRRNGEVAEYRPTGQVAKQAGFDGFSFKLSRKLYAEYVALQTNFDIRKIQSRLGHRSPILSYISRVVFKVHGQLRLSDFQKIIVERLGNGKDIDPTLLKNHWVNRKDTTWQTVEDRIQKNRAQAGQLCGTGYKIRDKDNMLRDCESGRCALCKHALIDEDSWEGMSKRLAEIVFLFTESGLGVKALEAHHIMDEQDRLLANLFVHFQDRIPEIEGAMRKHFEAIATWFRQNKFSVNDLLRGL